MLWTLNNLTAQRTKRVEKLFNLLHFSHPDFFGAHQKNRGVRFLTKGLEWAETDYLMREEGAGLEKSLEGPNRKAEKNWTNYFRVGVYLSATSKIVLANISRMSCSTLFFAFNATPKVAST